MSLNWINIFKYIKLILVHPATEILSNILYLISFLVIGIIIFKESSNYDDHQILDITQTYLYFNQFNNIKKPNDFQVYLETILNKLYSIDPESQEIPLFIPMNPIRFIPFNNINDCSFQVFYNKTCVNEPNNKFKCVIDNLAIAFKNKCGKMFKDKSSIFKKKLIGYYSEYNIRKAKIFLDITKESYDSLHKTQIEKFIKDKQLKALMMQINLKAPSNGNFIDLILGVEMTNYFTDVKTIFSVYILNNSRPKTKIILSFFIILLIVCIIINGVKFLYEINIKPVWSIHIFNFFVIIFDICFMIICLLYVTEDKRLDYEINVDKFESHLSHINILWYAKTFYALLVMCAPFRLFSLLSWWKNIFEPFTIILNVIFRMAPLIIISLVSTLIMIIVFVIINYFLYNDIFPYYETIYNSFVSTFDLKILFTLYRRRPASRIFGNLFQSHFSIVYILFQIVFFYFILGIIIATLVYAFKKAIFLQAPPKDNKYMSKLEEIREKIEEVKSEEFKNVNLMKKQILWWNLDEDNYNNKIDLIAKYEALIFKNSNQIISFLKYIFAVKPEIQFKKLEYKINIVIEINKKNIKEKEISQINQLCEWLIFIGSQIPIILYGKYKLEISIIMKLKSIYKLIVFINDENNLKKILENKGKKILIISGNNNMTFLSQCKNNNNNSENNS